MDRDQLDALHGYLRRRLTGQLFLFLLLLRFLWFVTRLYGLKSFDLRVPLTLPFILDL